MLLFSILLPKKKRCRNTEYVNSVSELEHYV
jgi:hypothetical protein